MQKNDSKYFFYIDESGSPDFFGKRKRPLWLSEGFQPVLLLGMLETQQPRRLRKEVQRFVDSILADPLFNTIFSVSQPDWYLHAKNDHPEIRVKFFEFIRGLDYVDCYVIVARKIPELFIAKHNGNAKEFYFDVLHNLIRQYAFRPGCHYQFYLSRRDSSNTKPFTEAVQKVVSKFTNAEGAPLCSYQCDIVRSKDSLELSVLDYLLWSVQRYILKKERRYLTAMEEKIKLIYDVYDDSAANKVYDSKNPFDLEKAGDFMSLKK